MSTFHWVSLWALYLPVAALLALVAGVWVGEDDVSTTRGVSVFVFLWLVGLGAFLTSLATS